MIGWIILVLLLALIAVIAYRALRFTPKAENKPAPVNESADADRVGASLAEIVRFKTVSHPDASLDDEAEFLKLEKRLRELYPKTTEKCGCEKIGARGLLFRWEGKNDGSPLILTAHYDVVPAEGSEWSKDPFSGEITDGAVWGRGTLDTKCTLISAIEAVEELISEGYTPERTVYLCFAGDEEVMGGGAEAIVTELEKRGVKPYMVLDEGGAIVENVFPGVKTPCALIGVAEKGSANYRITARGTGGHASAPLRVTPVDRVACAVARIHSKPFGFRVSKPAAMLFDSLARHSTLLYRIIFANLWLFLPVLKLVCRNGGEMNALMRTTLAFTEMQGSEAANVLPQTASVTVNARILPGDTRKSVFEKMKRSARDEKIEISLLGGSDPSGCSPADADTFGAVRRAIGEVYPSVLVSPYLMIACSDARHYESICPSVFRFSGMPLSSAERRMIHGVDEHISVKTLADTVRFYKRLIKDA